MIESNAQSFCERDGGHLVEIGSDEENSFIEAMRPGILYEFTFIKWLGKL